MFTFLFKEETNPMSAWAKSAWVNLALTQKYQLHGILFKLLNFATKIHRTTVNVTAPLKGYFTPNQLLITILFRTRKTFIHLLNKKLRYF